MDIKMIVLASRIVAELHRFEMTNPNSTVREARIVDAVYKNAPNPKLVSIKHLYMYINDIDVDEWQGEQNDARVVAQLLVQNALESGIATETYPYFKRKVKSDLVLAEYLKGGNIPESKLRNALNGLDEDYEYLKKEARRLSNHDLRYEAIRTRDEHERKMRTLQGAINNKRLHGVVVINPNQSRSLGLGNRVRKALKFW